MEELSNNSKPRILICRLSHIGDCVLTLPLLRALRQKWPSAWIAWAVENPTPQLLQGHPDLDEVITVPRGWMKSPKVAWKLRRQLRAMQFDIALDPQSLAKSSALAWISGAKKRIGFSGKKYGRECSTWLNNRLVEPESDHLVDRSLELLAWLGVAPSKVEFDLPIRGTAIRYIEQFLDDEGLIDSPVVAINPGASWPSKRWQNDRFAEVAKQIHERTGIRSVVTWAGDAEKEMALQIERESAGAVVLAPETDLQQLAALLGHSDIFIGCDTGPLHMAVAMGTVCVGLYGPTRPQDSGAYGDQHFAIQNLYQAGTSRERRSANNDAMRTITVEQVVDNACRALAAVRVAQQSTSQSSARDSRAA